jgi:DNA-binding NarL/FixJ family response regulator
LLRILVIDEEDFVRDALQRVLSESSIVSATGDVATGLAWLRSAQADLVIIDVVLPAIEGVAAIRTIRRDHPATRIIAITGSGKSGLNSYHPEAISTSAYLAACTTAGAHGALAKPFETGELRDLIRQVCPSAEAVNPGS